MSAEQDGEPIERTLLNTLKYSGLDKEYLEALVKVVGGFYAAGLQTLKVFPRGITPVTDGLEVQASVTVEELPPLMSLMIAEPWVQNFVFFPRGLPSVTDVAVVLALGAGRAG
jgi:hypothetical protein